MKYPSPVKVGRTAATQTRPAPSQAFANYAAMVDRLSAGYLRPLKRRLPARKASA